MSNRSNPGPRTLCKELRDLRVCRAEEQESVHIPVRAPAEHLLRPLYCEVFTALWLTVWLSHPLVLSVSTTRRVRRVSFVSKRHSSAKCSWPFSSMKSCRQLTCWHASSARTGKELTDKPVFWGTSIMFSYSLFQETGNFTDIFQCISLYLLPLCSCSYPWSYFTLSAFCKTLCCY